LARIGSSAIFVWFGIVVSLRVLFTTRKIPDDAGWGSELPTQCLHLQTLKLSAAAGGLAIQDELGDIGQGDGVAAGNAPESNHPGEIAEEAIDGGCVGKIGDRGEEFGASGLAGAVAPEEFLSMVGAKVRRQVGQVTIGARAEGLLGRSDKHTAAVASGVDMLATVFFFARKLLTFVRAAKLLISMTFAARMTFARPQGGPIARRGDGYGIGVWHGKCAGHPLPPTFFARM
jgi:hypothetical protein